MLRNIVLAIGGGMLAFGAMAALAGKWSWAAFLLVWGAVFVFGIIYERYGYKSIVEQAPAGKGWVRTSERFVDEKSGRRVTVWTKPFTGERAYVAEASPNPAPPPPVVEG